MEQEGESVKKEAEMQNHEGKLLPMCFNSSLPFVIPNNT